MKEQYLYAFIYEGKIKNVYARSFVNAVKKIIEAIPETKPLPVESLKITKLEEAKE